MILLVEVKGNDVVRHEWFFDEDRSDVLPDAIDTWKRKRGTSRNETCSQDGHRWYLISPASAGGRNKTTWEEAKVSDGDDEIPF